MPRTQESQSDRAPEGQAGGRLALSAGARHRGSWLELSITLALPLLLFVVYVCSPIDGLWDSKYAILTSEAILEGQGFDLARFLPSIRKDEAAPGDPAAQLPWQLERSQGRLLYLFPPGTPVLSLPLVAGLRALGYSSLDEDGLWRERRESWMQLLTASLVSALTALLVLRLARHEVALLPATVIALIAGLGSSLWTVASHELWSHTWSALLLGAGWLELLRWEEGRTPRPLLLGAIAGAAYWVRPSNAWIAVAWTVFVALRHRRQSLRLILAGSLALAAYCTWSLHYSGALLPFYVKMARSWSARNLLHGLAESLVSTHHGLLVYSPVLLAAGYALLRYGVPGSRRPLAVLGSILVLGHLGLHAASGAQWGPDGPRLQHDLVPILAWFGAVAIRRQRELAEGDEASPWVLRPLALLVMTTLAAASILASIGSVQVGRRSMGKYRAQLEASYPKRDLRRLPQYMGLRALTGADSIPHRRPHKKGARNQVQ